MSSDKKPVVFLAFANEYEANRRLDNVVKERAQLESILNEAYRKGLCDKPVVRQNVSIKSFLDILENDEWKNRIAIIHYGGHADGYQLLLEGMDGNRQVAKGDGLVNILASRENQENLKLVFLNGCSTDRLAKALTDRGVPIVIGTATSIKDNEALTVATRFYSGLANGLTMAGAWADAKNEVESVKDAEETVKDSDKARGIKLNDEALGSFPWKESFRDSAAEVDFKNWNLPEESQNPLFDLPIDREKTILPAPPFPFLKPYQARHAEIFFGRSKYIRKLWSKVKEPHASSIILVQGEPGAGKSSLLDAGLRPRLEAHKKAGKNQFKVLYMRRDQQKGLVGTLAGMLSYTPEQKAAPAEETEEDPNLDKIQQIEQLASELEAPAASFFQDVIDGYKYKFIQPEKPGNQVVRGLYKETPDGKLKLHEPSITRLHQAWIDMEKKTGCELIIILDQVDEAITHPNLSMETELEDLLRVLRGLFVRSAAATDGQIKGKFILGYREQADGEIQARSQDFELSPSTVFLEPLKKDDIIEIFRELPKVRGTNHYNLTIDPGLPERIADDLLNGRNAVALMLQLVLRWLWEDTHNPKTKETHFSAEAYNKITSDGEVMEKYFRNQMEKIREEARIWKSEAKVVESGLVLDILRFHVPERGASGRRNFEEDILPRYSHVEEEYGAGFIKELIKKLKNRDIFLLNDEGEFTSLPYDTFSPIIREAYERSDKPGQKAARILNNKEFDLKRIKEEEAGLKRIEYEKKLKKLCLNEKGLEVVREGRLGMRSRNEKERSLLRISAEVMRKRQRQRQAWAKAGIMGGLFILALSVLAGLLSVSMNEQRKQQVIVKALETSLTEQVKTQAKPSLKAIQLAQFAYNNSKTLSVEVVNNLYGLYEKSHLSAPENNIEKALPLSFSLKQKAKIKALDYYSPLSPLLAHYKDSLVICWPGTSRRETVILNRKTDESLNLESSFSADRSQIQVISYSNRQPLYIAGEELVEGPWMKVYTSTEKDGSGQNYRCLGYYDFLAGRLVDEYGRSYTRKAFLEEYATVINRKASGLQYILNADASDSILVSALFSLKLMDDRSGLLDTKKYEGAKNKKWWKAVKGKFDYLDSSKKMALRKTHLSRSRYHNIWFRGPDTPAESLDSVAINKALFFFQGLSNGRFLAIDTLQRVVILDAVVEPPDTLLPSEALSQRLVLNPSMAEPADTLLPPEAGLLDLAISPSHQHIFAMTNDSAYIWGLSGELVIAYPHEKIKSFSFSDTGYRLLTVSDDSVKVLDWAPDQQNTALFTFSPLSDTTFSAPAKIVIAHFHENDGFLVIGLEQIERSKGLFNSRLASVKARIVYWNFQDGQGHGFESLDGALLNATVSKDGQYAVALQAEKATVLSHNSLWSKTFKAVNTNTNRIQNWLRHRDTSKIWISSGGQYIVRQSSERVELFSPSGQPVNAYSFKKGYNAGFKGQLFTPDDYFIIGETSDKVLFWHPKDELVRTWSAKKDYELSIAAKHKYELTTLMDNIPGTKDNAKWWSLRLLLASLAFVLLYYSDFIIQSIQQKRYLEPALYLAGFFLFSLLLLFLWTESANSQEARKAVFYSIIWATLALLSIGIYSFSRNLWKLPEISIRGSYREQLKYVGALLPKYGTLLAFGAVGAFILIGSARFFLEENTVQLASGSPEWNKVRSGFFITLAFLSMVGYPLYRIIQTYRVGDFSAYYRWLLLPAGFLILIFWITFNAFVDNVYGGFIAILLSLVATLMILWAISRQSRAYLVVRNYVAFAVFAFPIAGMLTMILKGAYDTGWPALASLSILALPTAFILGRQSRREGAYQNAFLLYSITIFLIAGALFWAGSSLNNFFTVALNLLLVPLLIFTFNGLHRQLRNRAARRADNKSDWLNWVAILGCWILAFSCTFVSTLFN